MQIGGEGIGDESLFHGGHRIAKPEAAGTMSHIEDHATGAGFRECGIELAVRKKNGKLLSEDVGVYIARPHSFQNQLLVTSVRPRPEVNHNRNIRKDAAFQGTVRSGPRHVLRIPGPPGPVMSSFHSHNEIWILLDRVDAKLHIHLVEALL